MNTSYCCFLRCPSNFFQRITCSGDEEDLILIPSLQLPRRHFSVTTYVSHFWQVD
ncbi:hypothetical protein NC651_040376 [Populus alba x Populus x berolinensis]|nr:hypothetical protein NC651_040376 [Populus alba x Populus x berolinensis]